MSMECSHREAVEETVRVLRKWGYIVKKEAWICTTLDFKYNIANAFLRSRSPWISLHNPYFQTRLDVIGLYYADYAGMDLYTFFARKRAEEIALRTILILSLIHI